MIEGLCKEVEKRMVNVGVKGVKVTLKVKQRKEGAPPPPKFLGHGSCYNLSKSLDTRNGKETRDWERFYELAIQMFTEMKVPKDDVRGMGIVVSKLASDGSSGNVLTCTKQSIANWFSGKANEKRIEAEDTQRDADSDEVISGRRRIVGFAEPESITVHNNLESELDYESSGSVEVLWEGRTNKRPANVDEDYDIALPALSQIHMSQVDELPSPMRKQIVSKMEAEKTRRATSPPTGGGAVAARDARFRQTDVKRMFRLAAVKAGVVDVENGSGSAISLTQLESLPLELQLQVANDDARDLGALSPEKRSGKAASTAHSKTYGRSEKSPPMQRRSSAAARSVPQKKTSDVAEERLPIYVAPAKEARHFFRDNVQPLSIFMDDNPYAEEEATSQVVEFLCLCVTESRLSDVAVLLRSMKNRKDSWSSLAFDSIFTAVDKKVQEGFRASLDMEWVLQL